VGIAAIGSIGSIAVSYTHVENAVGVTGTGSVGVILIRGWSVVDDYQDPNWVQINVA
jgi:hypothetical protein